MEPRTTSPTPELEQESPQEQLQREQLPDRDDLEGRGRAEICAALRESGALRNDALVKAIGFEGDPEEWKRRLWRLHNEGYVKVRWVGLADPDPVEVRLGDRGWELLLSSAAASPPDEPVEPGHPPETTP
jgi:hypothetical protein